MAGIEDVLPGPVRSFFYGNAPADSPLSYSALQTRRRIAEQLMGRRSPFPKTIGEGLTYVGEAIGDRMQLADLERREREQGAYEDKRLAELMGGNASTPAAQAATPAGTTAGGAPTAAGGGPVAITPEPGTGREPFVFNATDVSPMDAAIARPPAAPSIYRQAPVRPDPARSEVAADMAYPGALQGGAMKDVPPDLLSPDLLGGEVPRSNAGLQPIINARDLEIGKRDVVNPVTGARVIAGQMSPSSFMGRAYGALPTEALPAAEASQPTQAGGAATSAAPTVAAQAPGDMFSPVPQAQRPPIVVPGAQPAPSTPLSLSQEVIPPKSAPYVTEVRPEPKRPEPLPLSPDERKWAAVLSDRRIDPNGPLARTATQQLEYWKGIRQEKEKQAQEEYTHQRGLRDAEIKLREQRIFENPKRALDEMTARVGIAQKQLEIAREPLAIEQAKVNLAKAQADLIKLRQDIAKPEGIDVGGGRLEREVSPEGVRGPYVVPPGAPAPEVKYTEQQAKAAEFVNRVTPDLRRLEQLDNGKVLAISPFSAAGSRLPGVGNVAMTDAYRQAMNAQLNWGAAFLTHVSGAAVSPSEASRNLPAFLVQLGDNDRDIAEKAERRRIYTEAIGKATGSAGKELIDKANADYLAAQAEKAKEPVRISSPDEARSLPPGRRLILPDGSVGQVPVRIRP
jgi:hypothetical protein